MNKFFYFMGVIFTCLLITIGFCFVTVHFYAQGLDKASHQVVDNDIQKIAQKWDANVWYQYVDMDKIGVTNEQFAQFLTTLQTNLGDLKEYKGSKGDANISVQLDKRSIVVSAKYESSIECEHGAAKISVSLLKEDSGWKIIGFHVTSPTLDKVANPEQPKT